MLSPSLEDYLEELYKLYIKDYPLKVSTLARTLNVSSPSVIKGLKKLHMEEYIVYERYQGIIITQKGKELGNLLVKRNDIIIEFLKTIDCDCDYAAEAEAVEHFLSSNTVASLKNLVNFFIDKPQILNEYLNYKNLK